MAIDREKTLQAAAKLVDKKKYDKAIVEYQKIVQSDPSDTRTLLKIGDLQTRLSDFAGAIATYDHVAQFYTTQGFQLKAIAVFKQVRELIRKHAPELAPKYGHITPRLAEIYAQLNLISDALAAYDEVATGFQKAGRDRDAVQVFRRIVALDPKNPLSHLRLAEAACRIQELDAAIDSFWTASSLLLALQRPDDALKVIERILHFRQDPLYARAAAELYLKRDEPQAGMQALAKLQIAFQANPKDLDTLALLAQAFEVIGQPEKAFAVHVEMARLAREQGKPDLFREILAHLKGVAPGNDQVLALERLTVPDSALPPRSSAPPAAKPPPSKLPPKPGAPSGERPLPPPLGAPRTGAPPLPPAAPPQGPPPLRGAPPLPPMPPAPSSLPPRPGATSAPASIEVHGPASEPPASVEPISLDAGSLRAPAQLPSSIPAPPLPAYRDDAIDLDDDAEYVDDASNSVRVPFGEEEIPPPSGIPVRDFVDAEERGGPQSFRPSAHAHKSIVDAEAFRRLGLLDKAVEALHIALEIDPNSVPIRQKLREILVEAGEREPAIIETLNIAIIHLHNQDADAAEPLVYEVLDIEPDHPDALNILAHVHALREGQVPPADGHFESYDLEGVPPASAMGGNFPGDAPLPAFSLADGNDGFDEPERPLVRPSPEAIEEVLEEAEFFAAQGLYADAEAILTDLLRQAPDHVLLRERIAEVHAARAEAGDAPDPESGFDAPTDHAFDIAASLDALDGIEQPTAPRMSSAAEEVDVDQVFAKFKEGVKATVDDADAATHYDLGVAYKEMGLLPDARAEFELASRDPARTCMCFYMIGSIFQGQGDLDQAAEAFGRALAAEVKTNDQEKNLRYELALLHEKRGDSKTYLAELKKIAAVDPVYKDVTARIRALGATPPEASSGDDELDAAFDNLFG